jgi:hypothetical protein
VTGVQTCALPISQITGIAATTGTNAAAITTEQTARTTADSANASQTQVLSAATGSNNAAISAEQSARTTGDAAITAQTSSLLSRTADNAALVFTEQTARTTADAAAAAQINGLSASTGNAFSAVQSEATARSTEDTALALSITTLSSQVNDPTTGLPATRAELSTNYLTATDTENAIAQSSTFLRAYADVQSKVFRQADEPTKRGVDPDPEIATDIPLETGDVWYDTNDSNKLYLWSGTEWVYSPDAEITGSVTAVGARVTSVENTKIGYCTIGGVASDDTNKVDCEAAGGTWNVGIPIATAVKQVSISDGEDSATLEQRFTAQKTNNDVLLVQYTVKLEVNGYVSGFGLASTAGDSVPTTDFIVNADKFAVAAPMFISDAAPAAPFDGQYWRNSITGAVQRWNAKLAVPAWETRDYKLPLAVLTTAKTINDVAFAPGVYIDGANITSATIGSAQIADLAVDDAKIVGLDVGKLTAGSLQADSYIQSSNFISGSQGFSLNANGTAEFQNAVVRGTVFATDGQFVGEVIAQGAGGNRARMFSGNFEIYKDVPAVGTTLYKALSRIEAGVGANNVVVTIPGYFSAQPKIIVSPANIKLYDHTFANQSQSLQCEALDIVQTSFGSMVWQFTPKATLSLAANTGQTVVNQASGTLSTGWTSSQYTTPANTASITPNITLTSSRGTGTSGNFFFRTVRWRVEYFNGSSFVAGSWNTSALGASVPASVTTNATFTFPSAGTWVFRIVTEAFDSGGTFNIGTEFETATDNISRTGNVLARSTSFTATALNYTPSYSLPSGWSIVSVQYTFTYSYFLVTSSLGSAQVSGSGVFHSIGSNALQEQNNLVRSFTNSSNSLTFSARGSTSGSTTNGTAEITLHSATGVVTRRRPLTNSTTANNSFSFNYYDFDLAAAQVLATGSLNWLAIGE